MHRGSLLLFLFGSLAWGVSPAVAQDPEAPPAAVDRASAVDVAQEAQRVLEAHCAAAQADSASTLTGAVEKVAPAWGRVDRAYAADPQPWLLYWRGALGQCMNQPERAIEDLQGFAEAAAGDPTYDSLVADARRRVRLMTRKARPASSGPAPGAVVGGVLAGSAVPGLALGAWQSVKFNEFDGRYHSGDLRGDEYLDYEEEATRAGQAATVPWIAGGATAVGSIAAFVITAAQGAGGGGQASRGGTPLPVVGVAPTEGGAQWTLGVRW